MANFKLISMKTLFLFTTSVITLLLFTGCGTKEPQNAFPIGSAPNPTADQTTVQHFDIVTTTYNGSDELAISAIVEPGVITKKKQDGTLSTIPTPSYTAAINDYGNGRFQFVNCSGNPGNLNVAKKQTFMLDNRDATTNRFTIASQTYELKGYDFALVQITKAGTYSITCDGGGAAQVVIQ